MTCTEVNGERLTLRDVHDAHGETSDGIAEEVLPPVVGGQPVGDGEEAEETPTSLPSHHHAMLTSGPLNKFRFNLLDSIALSSSK